MTTVPEEAVKATQNELSRIIGEWERNRAFLNVSPGPKKNFIRRQASSLTAALPHLPQGVGVKVKPLDWNEYGPTALSRLHSKDGLVRYTIAFCGKDSNDQTVYRWAVHGGKWSDPFYYLDDARAAAQADYEARILSALEPSACKTCNGRGIIGGMYRIGDGDVDAWEEPCPECAGEGHHVNKIARAISLWAKTCGIQTVKSPDILEGYLAAALATEPSTARELALEEAHADDVAVDRFAVAMKEKLAKKRAEGRGGWENKDECSAEYLSYLLIQHIWKGDPVDIANLAMMLQQRGERVVIDSETSSIIPDHADAGKVEGDGWLDMASAPMDGAVILVYRADAGVFTAHYVEEDAHLSSPMNPPEGDFYWFSTCGDDLTNDMPTHWRPFPLPPVEGGDRHGE